MAKEFQPAVREAIDLIWGHFDPESARRGQELLRRAAAGGEADAWGLLARTYMGSEKLETWETSGLEADEKKVNECLKWSLLGGSALGVLCAIEHRGLYPTEMAEILSHWGTVEAALEEAREYDREAMGAHLLGLCYASGSVCGFLDKWEEDSEERRAELGLPYLEKAMKLGLALSYDTFGACAQVRHKSTGNLDKVEKALAFEGRFAKAGVPHVLFMRGKRLFGEGEPKEVFDCMEQAGAQGHREAIYWLGYMCRHGLGTKEVPARAMQYFLPMAEQGYVPAMGQAAEIYFWGELGERDFESAYQWCERMLDRIEELVRLEPEAGIYNYEMILPLMCYCKYYGYGTIIDREMATRTILRETDIAEREDNQSETKLALLQYLKGEVYANGSGGLEKNKALAREYKEKAKAFEGFEERLGNLEWDKSPDGFGCRFSWSIFGRPEDTKTRLTEAEDIRSWQDERINKARCQDTSRQPWRLCLDIGERSGANFVRYREEELEKALEMLDDGLYNRIKLDREKDEDYLMAGFDKEAGEYWLYASFEGVCRTLWVKERTKALGCFKAWLAEGKLDFTDWQEDETGSDRNKWNELIRQAYRCRAAGNEAGWFSAMKKAASLGSGRAMVSLGVECARQDDFKSAEQWYQNAILTEDDDDTVVAWYWLGRLYLEHEEGHGLEARYYLEKAAECGMAWAWSQLAYCYLKGIGTAADHEKALACLDKGVEAEDHEAMLVRARLCCDEEGNWQEFETAIPLLERAIQDDGEGNEWQNEARLQLAKAYLARDAREYGDKAKELLGIAAAEGFTEALYELAHLYKEQGNLEDYRQAMRRAAEKGYEPARQELDETYADMAWSECL